MALALEARAKKDDVMIGDTPKAVKRRRKVETALARGRIWKHSTLRDIDGLYSIAELDALFAFTLVRNPWDRMVSYYHWLRSQRFDHPAVQIAQTHEFASFLKNPVIQTSLKANPYGAYMIRADGVEQCQSFIRLEHFREDVEQLEAHLGFDVRLAVENRSDRRRDYRHYFTDETADIVAEICADDIRRFEYRFDG